MTLFRKLFQDTKPVIGMVHLLPLPGAPGYRGSMEEIYEAAHNDLKNLIEGGADAVIVENFGDIPYAKENELITNTAFASVASRLRRECTLPMGINVQFDNVEAEWAIAYSCDYDFIRSEVFAENRMGPNGVFTASGPQIMRLKARYPKDIALLADVNVKHTFPVTEQPLDPPRDYFPVLCKFWQIYGGFNGHLLQEGLCHTQVSCTQPYPRLQHTPAPVAVHC